MSKWFMTEADEVVPFRIRHEESGLIVAEARERDIARLIAAAPELLEALKSFIANKAHFKVDDHFNGPFRRLLELSAEIVTKAEGRDK